MQNSTQPFSVTFNHEIPCVIIEWGKTTDSKGIRDGLNELVHLASAEKTGNLILFTRNFKLSREDKNWLNESWLPRATEAGCTSCAFIASVDYIDRSSVESIITAIDRKYLDVEYFDNLFEAEHWLIKSKIKEMQQDQVSRIYYNPIVPCVVMEWRGYATSKEFRTGTQSMLDLLIEKKASKVIADVKNMKLISMEDQKWVEDEFLPRALKAGFRVMALITSNDYFNRVSVENITQKIDPSKLVLKYFDNIFSAEEWLKMY